MKLPEFIFKAVSIHNTSVGKNDAFPHREDVSFEYVILKHRFEEIIESINKEFGYIPTPTEAENLLNKLMHNTMKIEEPLRPQLEKLCEAIVNNVLGVPQETVLLDCELVDKIEPDNELRIMPEDDENEPTYTFDDVDELSIANKAILKRRLINTLVQGSAYLLMTDFYDNEQVVDWSDQLGPLYTKIIALNDYLLFVKKEVITDKKPMLGAYVETHLGKGDEKTVISVQGLIFPLLLQETFRGFFELFASHGLPEDTKKANYIIRHADFLMAEAWDLRIGVPLWERIENCSDYTPLPNVYPYIMSSLVQQNVKKFNLTLQNIFAGTTKGKEFLSNIINQVKHDDEYNLFKQDIQRFNLEKCVINDDENSNNDIIKEENKNEVSSNVICDKNGKPIICYHSTQAQFNNFDPNKINSGGAGCYHGFGFNFTTHPNTTYGSNVIEAYLTAKKPLWDKKKTINLNKLMKILMAIDKGEQDSIVCNFTGNCPKIGGPGYWYEIQEAAKSILDYAEGDLDIYANICTAACCSVQKVIDIFSKLGYDSAIETYEDGSLRVVVVFYPEQIHIISEPLVKESLIKENKYDQAFNDAYFAFENFKREGAQKYGIDAWYAFSWIKLAHPEIQIDPADELKYNELKNNLEKISKLWNQRDTEEEKNQIETENKFQHEQANLIDLAVKEFGTTDRLSQAGYILPDGRLLNFGQDGERSEDHRQIALIYHQNNIPIWNDEYRYNYVVDFLNHGAIRIDGKYGNIDMTMEPTDAEYSVLKDIVRRTGGEAYVDFTDNRGNTIHSIEYDHVTPQRLVADIHKYYVEGLKPLGDIQEGKRKHYTLKEDSNFEEWFHGSKVVNPDGSPKLMYRGDNTQIDAFDRTYSSSSNLYGTGFYFTDSQAHASQYGNPQPYYLRIVHPLLTNGNEITEQQFLHFLSAVDEDEDYGLYNYGQDSTIDTVFKQVWGKSDFDMIQDVNATCIGDMVKATELFNKVNKTDFDGFILPAETVVFDNNQIKNANKPLHENRILKEGISDVTYHYCSLPALYDILESGKMALTMSTNRADAYHKTKLFYLSTQRSKNPKLGYAGNSTHHGQYPVVRIELDGQLLKQDGYQGMPVDYWGASMGKQSDMGLKSARLAANYGGYDKIPNFDDTAKEDILRQQGVTSNFEFEDRIFSNKPSMPLKYIKRIDCYEPQPSNNGIEKAILELASKNGIFVGFYASEKDFVMQTDNLSNEALKAFEGTYNRNLGGRDEETRQRGNADTVARLSAALMYYDFYDNLENGQLKEGFYDKLTTTLQKFGLEQYAGYCEDKLPRIVMFLDQYIGEGLVDALRKLNTSELSRNKLSDNVMLYAQHVLNHYGVKSVSELRGYFNTHPWTKDKPQQTQESVECVTINYGGSGQIVRADDKMFWDRWFDKDSFYREIERQLDEDDWNDKNGYEGNRTIFYKSKNSSSFKKYLQYLMHNDNLSLYDGVVTLNKIFQNNQENISSMFGFTIEPLLVTKGNFQQLENKIKWTDSISIRKSLFGTDKEYYAYYWPTNESKQNKYGKQLNEYLDKDYMKPLFDYLRNGDKYSQSGYYNATERLVVPFFEWCRTQLDDNEWKRFAIALRNCKQLKGKIVPGSFMGKHTIDCYSQMSDGIKQVPANQFLRQNAKHIFNITYNRDPELAQFWDKFMMQFINTEEGDNMLKSNKSLDADTVLMNPELKRPQWLIHLTPKVLDAYDILDNGFKYGLGKNQMSKLGYTNNGIEKESKTGKYLYAYNAEEIANNTFPTSFMVKDKSQHKYEKPFDQKTWEYASQYAIMFTAPGIQAYHGTDKQNQVIFNADMAHNFVLLTRNKNFVWEVNTWKEALDLNGNCDIITGKRYEGEHIIGDKIVYRNPSLTDVVKWVINNFEQYRKQICWRK